MLIAFTLTPVGVGASFRDEIADAVDIIRESGLPYRSDSMYTMIEGEWEEVMDVVRRATEAVAARAPRVQLVLKADLWPEMPGLLDGKISTFAQHVAGRGAVTPGPDVPA
ncbi:MTH1187 family thiamine-binding protein [Streptomyces sp. NPDC008001]|uniref:thiamine-binding protein n=1 Tax=Streptomyces sp. NPDC008001 TaxID=3364804 RepID=UPI0036E25A92